MNNLSIEELKKMRMLAEVTYVAGAKFSIQPEQALSLLDELISIRELKGDQVPVAWIVRPSMESDVAYVETDPRSLDTLRKAGVRLTPLFTVAQKPVVLPQAYGLDCFDQLVERNDEEGFLLYKCEVIAAIEAAGGIVKDSE